MSVDNGPTAMILSSERATIVDLKAQVASAFCSQLQQKRRRAAEPLTIAVDSPFNFITLLPVFQYPLTHHLLLTSYCTGTAPSPFRLRSITITITFSPPTSPTRHLYPPRVLYISLSDSGFRCARWRVPAMRMRRSFLYNCRRRVYLYSLA